MHVSNNADRNVILELDSRRKVFDLVCGCPGIHFRDIQKRAGASNGALSYNLDQLLKTGLLVISRDGEFSRYYPNKGFADEDKRRALEILRRKTYRQIIMSLLENGACKNGELSHKCNLAPSTISFHLLKLVDSKILEKHAINGSKLFSLRNPELIKENLVIFKDSFRDETVNKFVCTYGETRA